MADDDQHPDGDPPGVAPSPEVPGRPADPAGSTPNPYDGDHVAFAPAPRPPLLQRVAPFTAHLPGYVGRYLRPDLLTGVTVAALAIPSGMAYAEVAGLSPVAGLYALLLPVIAYALLGSSR